MHDALGLIPSPTYRAKDHADSAAPSDYLVFHTYHSTFVFGLLCAVLHTKHVAEPKVAALLAHWPAALPEEWHGRRCGIAGSADQITHTIESWRTLAEARGAIIDAEAILRGTLDAYLLEAMAENRQIDRLPLLGMRRVAGPSAVDTAMRRLLSTRGLSVASRNCKNSLPFGRPSCELQARTERRSYIMEWRPLTPRLGMEVFGFDISRSCDEGEIANLRVLLLQKGVLVFRDQGALTRDAHIAFASRFGSLETTPKGEATHPAVSPEPRPRRSTYREYMAQRPKLSRGAPTWLASASLHDTICGWRHHLCRHAPSLAGANPTLAGYSTRVNGKT